MDFVDKVKANIERNGMLDPEQHVIVALSGGADSVALLAVLTALGYRCTAAHCDFHLRGEESERDRRHAAMTAARFNAEYEEIHFDVESYKKAHGVSTEMACRDLRYDWFRELSAKYGDIPVAVAHHRDDNIETFFLNVLRGSGITGVAGMKAVNGCIIRPLLDTSRREIIEYLSRNGIEYVTDSTNLINDVKRNRLRDVVLPQLYELFPDAENTITTTIDNLHDNLQLFNEGVNALKAPYRSADNSIDIARMAKECQNSVQLLYESIKRYGFNHAQAADMIASADSSGKEFFSADHKALIDRGTLIVSPHTTIHDQEIEIDLNDKSSLPRGLTCESVNADDIKFTRDANTMYLDSSALEGDPKFVIRHWREGDRMSPFGMKGSRLVSDIFSDAKMSLYDKQLTWLLTRNGVILWVMGMRASRHFPVTSTTRKAIKLTIDSTFKQQ
nr:tRNA lysidine(34) synthetase TilS [uncultured Muribaculum sp.]